MKHAISGGLGKQQLQERLWQHTVITMIRSTNPSRWAVFPLPMNKTSATQHAREATILNNLQKTLQINTCRSSIIYPTKPVNHPFYKLLQTLLCCALSNLCAYWSTASSMQPHINMQIATEHFCLGESPD
jgi:hypothetical protein